MTCLRVLATLHWCALNLSSYLVAAASSEQCASSGNDDCQHNGGWLTPPGALSKEVQDAVQNAPYNIEAFDASELTQKDFLLRFAYSEPVIVRKLDNGAFRLAASRHNLSQHFGHSNVLLASGNTHSYSKKTYFLFGDLDRTEWAPLLSQYNLPPLNLPNHSPVLSFGIAGAGTGVPFHFHGPGFAEVIYGRKRWFLYPFEDEPDFEPDATTLHWLLHKYPHLPRHKMPLECIMQPGEAIYFPDKWWHATLNVDTSVFVSGLGWGGRDDCKPVTESRMAQMIEQHDGMVQRRMTELHKRNHPLLQALEKRGRLYNGCECKNAATWCRAGQDCKCWYKWYNCMDTCNKCYDYYIRNNIVCNALPQLGRQCTCPCAAGGSGSGSSSACKDKVTWCSGFKDRCNSDSNVRNNCKRTCGRC